MKIKYNVPASQGKTREEGMKVAKGKWIAFLDDDDCWLPNKLDEQFKLIHSNTDVQFTSTNMYVGRGVYNPCNTYRTYYKESDNLPNVFNRDALKISNFINNSSVVISKSICDKVGGFVLGKYEDYYFWLRALEYTNYCYYIDKPLVYYDEDHAGGIHYLYV